MMMLPHFVCPSFIAFELVNSQSKIAAKGELIKSNGLAGFAMWETGGDSDNILLNAINAAVGNTC
jgi:chitinase